jgi:hypothetical protein
MTTKKIHKGKRTKDNTPEGQPSTTNFVIQLYINVIKHFNNIFITIRANKHF